ncbi:MAG: hypothetical protein KDC27_02320 [Acidobacteria bacterium]|nr:hypothetical protein [Acidobacteriota bacterium]
MDERFRIADLEIFGIGGGDCLARPKGGGAPSVLSEQDARMLSSCAEYLPLEEHAQRWAVHVDQRKVRQAQQQAPGWLSRVLEAGAKAAQAPTRLVEQTSARLAQLAEKGLLMRLSGFAPEMLAHGPEDPEEPIAALGFTTRRRAAELRRALDSYAANFRRHGRSPEVVVVDDSRHAGDEAETLAMLEEFRRETGFDVRFAGLAERESYAEALAEAAGLQPVIPRFALLGDARCPVTTGSARNSLLLDCATTRYVLADDDGMCRMAPTPEATGGLDVVSRNDPTQFWFFESRDALHRAFSLTNEPDLFGLHETMLGRSVGAAAAGELNLEASSAFESRLRCLGGVIRTSMAGVVGDSGVASSAYLLLEPHSRARLTTSEGFYRAAIQSRQMLRAPVRASVSDGFLTMAGNLGVDARSLFPPFPPVQRNSDGIVGRLLQSCFPASCRGYLNWAVLHDPVEGRSQSLDGWFEEIQRIRFADVLSVFLQDAAAPVGQPAAALESAGRRMMAWGSASPAVFREELRRRALQREGGRMAQIAAAGKDEQPAFYRALQERYAVVMREAVTREEYLRPRDLPDDSLALAQELTRRIGELLAVWPQLWVAAEWLRASGRRLSRPLA